MSTMTVCAAQPLLFDGAVAEPARPRTGKRGRGATPPIVRNYVAPRANPSGRRTLKYSFRPLARHAVPYRGDGADGKLVYEVASNLVAEYFQAIGGFRLADDAVVTAWADALDRNTPSEIRAAIAAKAKSLRGGVDADDARYKLGLRGSPVTFARERLDHWVDAAGLLPRDQGNSILRSPEPAPVSERDGGPAGPRAAGLHERLDRLAASRTPAGEPAQAPAARSTSEPDTPAAAGLDGLSTELRREVDAASRRMSCYPSEYVSELPAARRRIVEKAVREDVLHRLHRLDPSIAPDDPRVAALWLDAWTAEAYARWGLYPDRAACDVPGGGER